MQTVTGKFNTAKVFTDSVDATSLQQIKTLWGSLFAKPESNFALTPSKRIGSLVSNGAAIFDGILLGWKLYRKFRKKR